MRQTRNGLGYHSLENGCRDVFLGGALIQQWLNVAFANTPQRLATG